MFLIRVIEDGKPVKGARVCLSEPGFLGAMIDCHHTSDGWYEGNTNASHGKVFVNGNSYDDRASGATISI